MSVWGIGTFEDEIACDWLEDLNDSDPVAFLWHCLDLDGLDYLEHLACVGVICSAELVHGLCGEPRDGLPDAFHAWHSEHSELDGTDFLPLAIAGMRRVLGPTSELRERWDDNEQFSNAWNQHASELLQRLEADHRVAQLRLLDALNRKDAPDAGEKG